MDFILGNLAFGYAFHKTRPTKVVDKLIEAWVNIMTPNIGASESNPWIRGLRNLEARNDKASRQSEIRKSLGKWDNEYPWLHHELLIRYAAALMASVAVQQIYDLLRGYRNDRRR